MMPAPAGTSISAMRGQVAVLSVVWQAVAATGQGQRFPTI